MVHSIWLMIYSVLKFLSSNIFYGFFICWLLNVVVVFTYLQHIFICQKRIKYEIWDNLTSWWINLLSFLVYFMVNVNEIFPQELVTKVQLCGLCTLKYSLHSLKFGLCSLKCGQHTISMLRLSHKSVATYRRILIICIHICSIKTIKHAWKRNQESKHGTICKPKTNFCSNTSWLIMTHL